MQPDGHGAGAPQSTGSIWANREFMLLWVAQAISQTAQNAVWYGILVMVQNKSNSSAHMGLAITTLVLPSVLFGLLAGVYVDRWDKRLVLIASNGLRVAIVLAYMATGDRLALVYAVNFLFATVSQFFGPAEGAFIPAVVGRRELLQANSLFHLTFISSQLAGLVLVGPLVVKLAGVDGLLVSVAVLFAVCTALVWPLPTLGATRPTVGEPGAVASALGGVWADVKEVARFFHSDRQVSLSVIQWTLGAILSVVIAMLAPGFAVKVLNVRAEDSVVLLAPAGVGMVVATALMSRLSLRLNKQATITCGLMVVGMVLLLLGILDALWPVAFGAMGSLAEMSNLAGLIGVVMSLALVAGVAFVAIIVPSQTLIQERAPLGLRGRVIAIALMLGNVITILPLVFLGTLADLIGVDHTFVLLGLAVLVVAAASFWAGSRILAPAGS